MSHDTKNTASEFAQAARVYPKVKGQPVAPSKRVGVMLTLADLSKHFNVPQHRACEKLGICSTTMKRLCRKFGVKRWPYSSLSCAQESVQEWRAKVEDFKQQHSSTENSACSSPSNAEAQVSRMIKQAGVSAVAAHQPAFSASTMDASTRASCHAVVESYAPSNASDASYISAADTEMLSSYQSWAHSNAHTAASAPQQAEVPAEAASEWCVPLDVSFIDKFLEQPSEIPSSAPGLRRVDSWSYDMALDKMWSFELQHCSSPRAASHSLPAKPASDFDTGMPLSVPSLSW